MAFTKTRLLKHDFPVHGRHKDPNMITKSIFGQKTTCNFRNPEKGAFARGALHKFVANCAPNLRKIAGISLRTSGEGCAKIVANLSRI